MEKSIDKKYNKIFNKISKIGEIVKIEDFFDENDANIVLEYRKMIKNNKENEFWKKHIKNLAIESSALTQEIFLNSETPYDLLSDVIITTKHNHLLKDALKKHLRDAEYEYILMYKKKEIVTTVNEAVQYSDGRERLLKKYHPDFVNFLYRKHHDMFSVQLASFINDDLYIRTLLEGVKLGKGRDVSENEMAYIVSNENITEDARRYAFFLDCNYFLIENFPQVITNELFTSCMDFVFNTNEKNVDNIKYYQNARSILQKMVTKQILDTNKELELLNASLRNRCQSECWKTVRLIAKYSKNERVIGEIFSNVSMFSNKEIKEISLSLVQNKNLSILNKRDLAQLIQPYGTTSKIAKNSINEDLKTHILFLDMAGEMNDSFYNPYFLAEHYSCIKAIALNPNTPLSVLQRIQKEKFPPDEIKFLAILNECTKDNKYKHLFQQFCNQVANPHQLSFSHLFYYNITFKEFEELCNRIAEKTTTLNSKEYYNKIIKIKENIAKELDDYIILKEHYTLFDTTAPKNNVFYLNNFSLSNGFKTNLMIPPNTKEVFNELSVETLNAIKNKIAKELQEYIYVDNNDAEFYAKINHYTDIFNLCDNVIKERKYKENITDVELMVNSMTEEDKTNFCKQIEGLTEIWTEPSQEEIDIYNYIIEKNVSHSRDFSREIDTL